MSGSVNASGNSQIIDYLKILDDRISKIETRLHMFSSEDKSNIEEYSNNKESNVPTHFELNIGEHWFANIGILIMTIGFMLLLTLKYDSYSSYLPSLAGYIITTICFIAAKYSKTNFPLIGKQLLASGFGLLYLASVRLFHFSAEPFFTNVTLETVLLLTVTGLGLIIAHKSNSNYLFGLNTALIIVTGLIINNPVMFYLLGIACSALIVHRFTEKPSLSFIIFGISFVYLSYLLWSINNPMMTGEIKLGVLTLENLIFLLLTGIIFSLSNIFYKPDQPIPDQSVIISLLNGFFVFTITMLNILANTQLNAEVFLLCMFIVLLLIAGVHWKKGPEQYSKAIYSLLGYAALSVAIIKSSVVPSVYIILIWQSLLVAGTAIMFKSKNIIVANFFIFLIIFVAYLASVTSFSIIGLSFGIVALISARIINWQKNRLTVKTELMRNAYLIVALFSIPITLLESLPKQYTGLSLLGVTVIYYLLSFVLKNSKYRWMGHFTLLFAIIYSVIVGITTFDSTWSVITFLAIGFLLIAVSLIFTKSKSWIDQNKVQLKTNS